MEILIKHKKININNNISMSALQQSRHAGMLQWGWHTGQLPKLRRGPVHTHFYDEISMATVSSCLNKDLYNIDACGFMTNVSDVP